MFSSLVNYPSELFRCFNGFRREGCTRETMSKAFIVALKALGFFFAAMAIKSIGGAVLAKKITVRIILDFAVLGAILKVFSIWERIERIENSDLTWNIQAPLIWNASPLFHQDRQAHSQDSFI